MVLGLYFLIVIAMPLGLGSYILYNGLSRTRRCPTCSDDTLRLRSRPHRLASALMRSEELHHRWCMRCGWRGTARLPRLVPAARRPATPAEPEPRRDPTPASNRLDVRQIELDGAVWRVMIECRDTGRGWVARLVFVGPGGRSWADDDPIAGQTAASVISRAFGLSEQALAGRLRRVIR